jgi:hypothetical protein
MSITTATPDKKGGMEKEQTLLNRYGEVWYVEHSESERLTHIGGYVMTNSDHSKVTLSTQLSPQEKARGQIRLLEYLAQTATNTSGIFLWHPDDE